MSLVIMSVVFCLFVFFISKMQIMNLEGEVKRTWDKQGWCFFKQYPSDTCASVASTDGALCQTASDIRSYFGRILLKLRQTEWGWTWAGAAWFWQFCIKYTDSFPVCVCVCVMNSYWPFLYPTGVSPYFFTHLPPPSIFSKTLKLVTNIYLNKCWQTIFHLCFMLKVFR